MAITNFAVPLYCMLLNIWEPIEEKNVLQIIEWDVLNFILTKIIHLNPLTEVHCAALIPWIHEFGPGSALPTYPVREVLGSSCNAHHMLLTENRLVLLCKDCICHAQPWNQENMICTLLGWEWVEIILSVIDGHLACKRIVMIMSSKKKELCFHCRGSKPVATTLPLLCWKCSM